MTNVSAIELILRLLLSLAIVIGLILASARFLRNRPGFGFSRHPDAPKLDVLDRAPLGRNSSVAIVRVGGRGLVVGVTDQSVTLLLEAPELIDKYEQIETERTESLGGRGAPFSAGTNFLETLREKTVKRS